MYSLSLLHSISLFLAYTLSCSDSYYLSLSLSLSLTNTNTYFDHAWASYVSEQVEKTRSLMLWRMRSLSWSPKVKFWVRPSWRRCCSFCYAYTPLLHTYLPTYLCAYIFAYRPTYLHLPAPLGRHTLLLKVLPYFSLGKFSAHGEVPIPSRTFSCGQKCSFYF